MIRLMMSRWIPLGSDDKESASEDEEFWSEQESVDAFVFDDKNIAGVGEDFWSVQGSVDVSEADDENIVNVVEERYGSEKESVPRLGGSLYF
jgi:hypothetical protein